MAQREYSRWYFGANQGLAFPANGGAPQVLTDGKMVSGEGCASISDAQGNLLFYTNGVQAWNKQHQVMTNGTALGAFADANLTETPPNSATQGVAVVAQPGSSTRYYIFTLDAAENMLRNGLSYSVVDMSRQGGLGEVVSKNVPLPTPVGDGRLTEKLQLVRHANQQDVWVVVHAWNSNSFASFLLTPAGIKTTPVLSAGGVVEQGGNNYRHDYNALGCMKVSPDGRKLALVQYSGGPVELFDFNNGTGTVANPRQLDGRLVSGYGLEFSPNSNLLYASIYNRIIQYDVATGQQTSLTPNNISSNAWALQLGPDGRIYVAQGYTNYLDIIAAPNQPGTACDYRFQGLAVAPRPAFTTLGLPNVLVSPAAPTTPQVSFSVTGTDVCLGETTAFTAAIYPALPGVAISWDFGEPSAGAANRATGPTATHRYAGPGTYTATLTASDPASGRQYIYSQQIRILDRPASHLVSNPSVTCAGTQAVLSVVPTPASGTTYRWQDGSTGAVLFARTAGIYWVDITSPQYCPVRDSLRLTFAPQPVVSLGPDQLIACYDTITLDASSRSLPGSTYRWQDGSTAPQLRATQPGAYSVVVTTPAGCTASSTVTLRQTADCPAIIPNIITPNSDGYNDRFVVKGVPAGTFQLTIYNRWGQRVYTTDHYANDWQATGEAAGIYYYQLIVPGSGKRYQGWVEVSR